MLSRRQEAIKTPNERQHVNNNHNDQCIECSTIGHRYANIFLCSLYIERDDLTRPKKSSWATN